MQNIATNFGFRTDKTVEELMEDALREFVDDIDGLGGISFLEQPGIDWPDLAQTYIKAKSVLARIDEMRAAPQIIITVPDVQP